MIIQTGHGYPITDLLQRTMQWESEDPAELKLRKLEKTLGQYRSALEDSVSDAVSRGERADSA